MKISDRLRFVPQDDSAAIRFQTDKVGSFGSVTANSSFEEGTAYWDFQNVDYTQMFFSGGQDGSSNFLRFGGDESNSAIFSTARMTDSLHDGNQIGANIKGRVDYKRAVTSSTGYVHIVVKWRHIDYPGGGVDFGCQLSPASLNETPQVGAFEASSESYCHPSSSWAYCTMPTGNLAASDSQGYKPEGVDVRVVVYDHMVYGGDLRVPVDIDRTRALVEPS